MDFVRSHFGLLLHPTKSDKKKWKKGQLVREIHFSEVTSYKIHTLAYNWHFEFVLHFKKGDKNFFLLLKKTFPCPPYAKVFKKATKSSFTITKIFGFSVLCIWFQYSKRKNTKVWIFLRSYFFTNEPLISCPFLSFKLDSPVIKIKTLERHSLRAKKSFSNVLITGESNLDERNGQLIRGSFLNYSWIYKGSCDF